MGWKSLHRFFAHLVVYLLILTVLGCRGGSGPELVDVRGSLSRQGQPLGGYTLQFVPDSGRPSQATTESDGSFRAQYTSELPGVVPGRHRVIILSYRSTDPDIELAIDEGRFQDLPPDVGHVLQTYGDLETTPLEFEIMESQDLDIALD